MQIIVLAAQKQRRILALTFLFLPQPNLQETWGSPMHCARFFLVRVGFLLFLLFERRLFRVYSKRYPKEACIHHCLEQETKGR